MEWDRVIFCTSSARWIGSVLPMLKNFYGDRLEISNSSRKITKNPKVFWELQWYTIYSVVSYLIFSWVNLLEARDKAQAFAQDGHVRATAVGMAGGVTTLGSTGEGGHASLSKWSKPQLAGIYGDCQFEDPLVTNQWNGIYQRFWILTPSSEQVLR